jgi:hypothetical protein
MKSRYAAGAALTACALCAFQAADLSKFTITADYQSAMDRISADSMRGNLSFLASDLLEGRDTPSRGLDIAAEYIAAQFRRAGLEAGGDDGYFQTANMEIREPNLTGFSLEISNGGKEFNAGAGDVVVNAASGIDLTNAPVFKFDPNDSASLETLKSDSLAGKALLTTGGRGGASMRAAMQKLRDAHPALMITVQARPGRNRPGGQLVDPAPEQGNEGEASRLFGSPNRIALSGEAAVKFAGSLKPGLSAATISVHLERPHATPVKLHNIVAVLRGSDPTLKETYVLVSAHYDHIGMLPEGTGDRIYNGANDDGSGTVSVIEIGSALARLKTRPKRSIAFVTFFGEELGEVGSRYFAHHPPLPIGKIAADINLEQVGRTDSSEGPQISNATITGFDFSNLTAYIKAAGARTGIKVYKNEANSDPYFQQSDNLPLADAGIPAHSLSVAFQYPDYHGVGDEWNKIDYGNMAKVDRMVALALLMVADSAEAPHWNESNPKVTGFVKAWKSR